MKFLVDWIINNILSFKNAVGKAANIPKGPAKEDITKLLAKVDEITTSEKKLVKKDEVTVRKPPASHPLPLTQSQEATFESVEKLQAQLEELVEGEGEIKERRKDSDSEAAVGKEGKQKSPVRCESWGDIMCNRCSVYVVVACLYIVSQAIRDLSDITNGLNELLQSSEQARTQDHDTTTSQGEGATAASLSPPSK